MPKGLGFFMKNLFPKIFLSYGTNYYSEDVPLQIFLKHFGEQNDKQLEDLGKYVSESLIELLYEVDRGARPMLHQWSTEGERIDYVRLSPAHRSALKELQNFGIISSLISGEKSLMHHFISGYLVSDAGIFCTMTLTAQTAYAVEKYAPKVVREEFLPKFLHNEDAWYGATYYTELQGGSDLGSNSTAAVKSGDHYLLTGKDKYFASNAGIADAAIVTARLEGSKKGAKGISVFLVPAIRKDGGPNYAIRRLKDKLGTIAVPTGEVELENAEGFLLGSDGEGIYVAMEILAISRIDDAIAAAGIARKALWEAYLFAGKRTAFGKKLIDFPLMMKDFIELEAELEASLVLSILAANKFNISRKKKPPYDKDYHLARLLTNVAKQYASNASAEITRYSMEIMGGIGFLEEFPMAKFHRDSIVTSIWEGTGNIQALEFLEAVGKDGVLDLLVEELTGRTAKIGDLNLKERLQNQLLDFRMQAERVLKSENREYYSKELLQECGIVAAIICLTEIGSVQDNAEPVLQSALTLMRKHRGESEIMERMLNIPQEGTSWMAR